MDEEYQELLEKARAAELLRRVDTAAPSGTEEGGGLMGLAKSLGSGLVRGAVALADSPQFARDMFADSVGAIAGGFGADPGAASEVASGFWPLPALPRGASVTDAAQALMPEVMGYTPETGAGQLAQTVGEFAPGAFAGPGGVVRKAVTGALAPAAGSEAAGALAEGSEIEPWARAGGALLGGLGAGAGERVARRTITPKPGADPRRLELDDTLRAAGVETTAGQRLGDSRLLARESSTAAGQDLSRRQADQFTQAAMRSIGSDATEATAKTLGEARARIGKVFEDVTTGVDITPTQQMLDEAAKIAAEYADVTARTSRAPIIGNVAREISSRQALGQPITAEQLTNWRASLSKASAAGGATAQAARAMNEVLDGALGNVLTRMGRPEDAARLAEARRQWWDLLAIQKASTKSGQAAQVGTISPSALYTSMREQSGSSLALGRRGELGGLARAGEGVMTSLPESSSSPIFTRAPVSTRMSGALPAAGGAMLGGAIGGLAGGGYGASIGTGVGALAGSAVSPAVDALLVTPTMQSWLKNQVMGAGPGVMPSREAVLNALIQAAGQEARDGD